MYENASRRTVKCIDLKLVYVFQGVKKKNNQRNGTASLPILMWYFGDCYAWTEQISLPLDFYGSIIFKLLKHRYELPIKPEIYEVLLLTFNWHENLIV